MHSQLGFLPVTSALLISVDHSNVMQKITGATMLVETIINSIDKLLSSPCTERCFADRRLWRKT